MGALNRKRIAALARLAAFNRSSGVVWGAAALRVAIWGGRAEVRRVPYMAVVVTPVRSNPVIKNVYAQLRARGKYPEPAFTVRMRKLGRPQRHRCTIRCSAAKCPGKHLRSLPALQPFLICWARFLTTRCQAGWCRSSVDFEFIWWVVAFDFRGNRYGV